MSRGTSVDHFMSSIALKIAGSGLQSRVGPFQLDFGSITFELSNINYQGLFKIVLKVFLIMND